MKNLFTSTVTISKCMVAFTALLLFCVTPSLQAQWKQCNGLYNKKITGLFTIGTTLFAYDNGLFKSTDKGATWSKTEIVLGSDSQVNDIIEFGGKLFAIGKGVYASTNNGDTWKKVSTYSIGDAITTMGSDIFVGGYEGFCRSSDTGSTWTCSPFPIPHHYVLSLATMGNTLLAGLKSQNPDEGGGIYSSIDNGKSWNLIAFKHKYVRKLIVKDHFLYVSTHAVDYNDLDRDPDTVIGLYRSSDNGVSWTAIHPGFESRYVSTFTVNGTTLTASFFQSGLYQSTNNGDNWSEVKTEADNKVVYKLATIGSDIFSSPQSGGIYKTADVGVSWNEVGLKNQYVYSLNAVDNTIYVGSSQNGIYYSKDNGTIWNYGKIGVGSLSAVSIYGYGNTVLVGTNGGGIYQSTDSGVNWKSFNPQLNNRTIQSLAVIGTTVFAGTDNGLRYVDKDNVWQLAPSGQPAKSRAFAIIGNTLYGGGNGGVSMTSDYGETWTKIGLDTQNITILSAVGTILYACDTDKFMHISSDFGATWTKTGMPSVEVMSFVGNDKALFIATKDSGVYQSTDKGTTWAQMNKGLSSNVINVITLNGKTLFGGANGSSMWMYENAVSVSEPQNHDENISANQLKVYPNPAYSSITISRSNSQFTQNSQIRYSISSLVGTKLIETESSLESFKIPLNGIPQGVYLLSATQGTKQITTSFMVLQQD
ncbi:MAG: T9SS type A sorting domain-containing protein [Ignavibacteria bacterium]|nr:T9SS type A sorting domain-containing protein [Ignavibacteria bacterium]